LAVFFLATDFLAVDFFLADFFTAVFLAVDFFAVAFLRLLFFRGFLAGAAGATIGSLLIGSDSIQPPRPGDVVSFGVRRKISTHFIASYKELRIYATRLTNCGL
jgi:hypothetical protein